MNNLPKEVYWYGKKERLTKPHKLSCGPMDICYESGLLRNIRLGEYEVIRMIYYALRDHNWETIISEIKNEKIIESDNGFKISYESHFKKGDIRFVIYSEITGFPTGKLNFEINGVALSDFQTNRTGFCVLHPIDECKGRPCEITDPAGFKKTFIFPMLISPHQPMKDIAEMSWEINAIGKAHLKFEGDIFEMEDQRNWTDDSYKTYCRPLELPFPYQLKKGEKIHQKITLSVDIDEKIDLPDPIPFHLKYNDDTTYPLPQIGIGQSNSKPELSEYELALIKKANFDYYEVNIFFDLDWETNMLAAISDSKRLMLPLSLKIHFTNNYENEITELRRVIESQDHMVKSVTILQNELPVVTDDFIDLVFKPLKEIFTNSKIGAGTRGFFAELNRNRILHKDLEFLSFSMTPQVHAFDNLTLIENLNGQSAALESGLGFAGRKAIYISPVTLRMQGNPVAASDATENVKGLPPQVDPRQMSLFGAGWTLGSVKKLTEARAGAITYYEAVGVKGIVQGDREPGYPNEFQVRKNAVFPLFYVLKEILDHKDFQLVQSISSHPTVFDGLVLKSVETKSLILVNYSDQGINVKIDGLTENMKKVELDEDNVELAMYDPDDFNSLPFKYLSFDPSSASVFLKPFGISIIRECKEYRQ